ncbi:receptor-type tyrosine-protein phosphatase S-like [Penaeus japonicus]|uniref:receptor-type tyrosine-protein phosphatase S-like n=1 Tax=Penaeus japonicus TaxID=27405 RepID=UPI001C70B028|nr:receptor-type tyrosine-protein phosphatase S-like [Penaeus japonicus]
MAYVGHLTLGIVLSLLGGGVGGSCPTFLTARSQSLSCAPACLQPSREGVDPVFGTEAYNASSEICLSALHAGVVGPAGGTVEFHEGGVASINGTLLNRVVSQSGKPAVAYHFARREEPPPVSESELTEKVLVHNSYFAGNVHLSCVAEGTDLVLASGNIARLMYQPYKGRSDEFQSRYTRNNVQCALPFRHNNKEQLDCVKGRQEFWCEYDSDSNWDYCSSDKGPWIVHWSKSATSNLHAFRCLGTSPDSDILAVLQIGTQVYKALTSTVRASRGDRLQIEVDKEPDAADAVFVRRFPDDWMYESNSVATAGLPLTIDPVTFAHNGVYIVGNSETKRWGKNTKNEVGTTGAYFHLVVRDCAAGRFGWDCESWCPDCENGGVCHPRTGTCMCPPGYMGPTCQDACRPSTFGSQCQMVCKKGTLGFDLPQEGSCYHLTFCYPDPLGCSCAAGYTGPLCASGCSAGRYGAGCRLSCESFCRGGICDSVTGKCSHGCKTHIPCDNGVVLDLPRLRKPPIISAVNGASALVTFPRWDTKADDGSSTYTVKNYLVRYRRGQETTWRETSEIRPHGSDLSAQLQDLSPGFKYSVRVLVNTTQGFLDGSTNKRIQTVDFVTNCSNPTILEVEAKKITHSSVLLNWSLSFLVHPRCEVSYVIKLLTASGGSEIQRETNETVFNVTGLDPDTEYRIEMKVLGASQRESKFVDLFVSFKTLISPPSKPILTLEATTLGEIRVSWDLPSGSSSAVIYDISHRLLEYEACNKPINQEATHVHHTATVMHLRDLESYASYEVCVVAKNSGGSSPKACSSGTTAATAPEIQLQGQCRYDQAYSRFQCTISNACEKYNGPNVRAELTVRTFLECEGEYKQLQYEEDLTSSYITFSFNKDLLLGSSYNATFTLKNDAGTGAEHTSSFMTPSSQAPRVKDLRGVALSPEEVRLLWNDPCPPKGEITKYGYRRGYYSWTYVDVLPCTPQPQYERCVAVGNLRPNTNYTFEIAAWNNRGIGYTSRVSVSTVEAKPGPPSDMSIIPGDSSIELSLYFPVAPGGLLLNYTVRFRDGRRSCEANITRGSAGPGVCKIKGLERGRTYTAEGFFCNSAGCGPVMSKAVATLPIPPRFSGSLHVVTKTDTNITVSLPSIQKEGDGVSSLIILVQHIPKEEISNYRKESFVELYTKLWRRHQAGDSYRALDSDLPQDQNEMKAERKALDQSLRRKRQARGDCKSTEKEYIAGVFSNEQQREFVIGGEESSYRNCPLTPDDFYMFAAVAKVDLLDGQSFAETSLDGPVKAAYDEANPLAIALPLLFLLALILLVLVVLYVKMFKRQKDPLEHQDGSTRILDDGMNNHCGGNSNVLQVHQQQNVALVPMTNSNIRVPHRDPPSPPVEDNIYENVGESASTGIPRGELEAYLNRIIGTQDAAEDFKKIPATMDKSMSYGEQLQVKKKNRFRNNLPFDETRVKLSVINEDPFSDYINANHVYGFGGYLRYIASQGPKDANVNTIGDFWRMIYEQKMDIIIMVANFIEGGKVKVGEYFQRGATLEFDGYVVSAIKSEQHPHYVVSAIQLWKGDVCHTVTHYHYTRWPDHGVPSEAHTLAAMMRDIINTHKQGGAVVHCSAGIGRTGTVLLVLLMHEVLTLNGDVDPVQVLRRLRECRARLVENQAQYNFGLEVFDEILYGGLTVSAPATLAAALPRLLQESHSLYARAKALPTGVTFRVGSQASVAHLNRSPDVVPADSRSIFLNIGDGQISSQYINAVRINGLDNPDTLIVTEHPMQCSVVKFWHLVIEKKCPSVILLNSFDASEQEEFPPLIPEVYSYFTTDSYSIQTQHVSEYEAVLQYSLTVTTGKDTVHNAVVYQVRDWPRGSAVPTNPDVLLTLADLVLSGPVNDSPILLCCADGVTACGLMAGVILTVERLQTYQEVDVYRTVVKLLRCRPQFFTSVVQFDSLYQAALSYIENYETYANFSG